ncbi:MULTISPECIES: hypothetical protein [unclassified Endozoicomonas]|uniref:hypothetical protein n=1 Tax=unclassified Endozoicomonas TaxID=2644528 RepID=UPI003BB7EFEF
MFSVLQIWLYRFPIILSALWINAGYCCTHPRADVQARCEEVLKAFPGVFTNVVFHDNPVRSLRGNLKSRNTLHIVASDFALYDPITVSGRAVNVGIVGIATDGKYPTVSLAGTIFSNGVDEFIRASDTQLLYLDGFELDAGGSFANFYGNLNHFIHAKSDEVTLKNLRLHKTGESIESPIYVEHSKKLEVSQIEIWNDGNKEHPVVATREVFKVQFSDSTVHGFPSECTLILHENSRIVSYSNFTYPVKHSQSWQSGVTPGIFIVYEDYGMFAAKLSFENIKTEPSASHDPAFDEIQVPLWVKRRYGEVHAIITYKNNASDRQMTGIFHSNVPWCINDKISYFPKKTDKEDKLSEYFVPECLQRRYPTAHIEGNTE